MFRFTRFLLLLGAVMTLNCCASSALTPYKATEPEMDFKQFFTGPVKAWGIVQSRNGEVKRRFEVDMVGSWTGDVGTLEESFDYYDGEKQHRTWYLKKIADNQYEGTASDIKGVAHGEQNGMAIKWTYVMKLKIDGTTYDVAFDDWMFRMKNGVLMNRSHLKKLGIRVAELTIFMQQQKPE